MANEIQALLERIDQRIQKLRAERRVLLKLTRANGAAAKRRAAAPKKKRAAPKKKRAPLKQRAATLQVNGTRQDVVFAAVADGGKKGRSSSEIYNAVSGQIDSSADSVRTMLYLAHKKGLVSRGDDGRWVAVEA